MDKTQEKKYYVLSVNPGSTTTKIALYENEQELFSVNIEHSTEEVKAFAKVTDQLEMREEAVAKVLAEKNVDLSTLSAVVGRGGIFPPIEAGGYLVEENLKEMIYAVQEGEHASNLGALIADKIASPLGIPAYIYDGVTSFEFTEIATITGLPDYKRKNISHVLNSKAMARKYAQDQGSKYEDLNIIVAHLGGGITVTAHKDGRIIDAVSDDEGHFSPERAGSMALMHVIDTCYSGKYERSEMRKRIRGGGGLKAHLGTSDCREVEKRIAEGDEHAKLIYEAMAYTVAKSIGALSTIYQGELDAIILTGGIAYSKELTAMISKSVSFIAPVHVYPGENEMESLTMGGLRILKGEEEGKIFKIKA